MAVRVAGRALDPDQGTTVLQRPAHPVRGERVGPEALVAVHGGGGEHGHRYRVLEQAGHELPSGRRQVVVRAGERVAPVPRGQQRLVQVPPGREEVGQGGPAHEGREQSPALADLFDSRTEQHHSVRRGKPADRAETEFHLTRAPLVLHRAGRQPDRGQPVPDRLKRAGHAVQPYLREVLVAQLEDAHLRRRRGEPGVLRQDRIGAEPHDVVLDLYPGEVVVARLAEFAQHAAHQAAAVQRHRLAVGEIDVAEHPAGTVGPWQDPERGRIRYQHDIREPGELIDAKAAARRERRHEHLVAAVEAVDRPGEVEPVRHGSDRHLGGQRLAARDAVLIDDGQADGAQVKLAYPADDRGRRRGLLLGVQTVAGHEAVLADPVDRATAELIRGGASHLATLLSGAHLFWSIMTSSIAAEKLSVSTSASEMNVSVRCTPLIWKIFASSNSRRCAWSLTLSRTSRSRPPVTTLMSSASGMARIARMISLRSMPGPAVTAR